MPRVAPTLVLNFTDCRKSVFLAYVGLGKRDIFWGNVIFFPNDYILQPLPFPRTHSCDTVVPVMIIPS